MNDFVLTRRWVVARWKLTARNPRAVVFTLAFPLLLLVLFSAIYSGVEVTTYGAEVSFSQFYTPAIAVFSLVTACYTTLVMGLANARDDGLLKRVRGTPLPIGIYLGAWVVGAVTVGLAAVFVLFAVAAAAFAVDIEGGSIAPSLVTLILGAGCLAALGVAVASLVRSADQATPVVQLTFLPLSFISGIWFPLDGAPEWLISVAHLFPLYHLMQAFGACFVPGGGWSFGHLAVLAAWGAGAMTVAAWRFRWEP